MSEDSQLTWHYGPTSEDPDPGKMWHNDCGGEVWTLDEGLVCRKCEQQSEEQQ